ncbi:MAG TPA: potassium channel family protein [Thermoguttaceae bacterium]|nr:potassium channel family protein [Thermoguttaceae bacterium]
MAADRHPAFRLTARWLAAMRNHRFDVLLCALVLLLLWTPVVRLLAPIWPPALSKITVTTLFCVVLLSAVFAVSQSRRSVWIALWMAVPGIVLYELNLVIARDGLLAASYAFSIAFLGYTIIVILQFLFVDQRVTCNTIFASLCVYLLLGVLWSTAYSLIEILEPGSFTFGFADEQGEMRFGGGESIFPIYYSFVTLTTLGYGDIVPASATARMLSAAEAVTGQLYLAVLVARLVGLHISQSTRHAPPRD